MTRWSILAIGFAVVACGEGERDRASRDASEAVADADSAARVDPGVTDTGAAGDDPGGTAAADRATTAVRTDADTDRARRATDADTGGARGADAGATRGPTGAEAMGGIRNATTPLELSADQVRRLQTALNDTGCSAGEADGVVGPRTRRAMACGLEKNNLGNNDLPGLYRSLDLDF